MRYLIFLLASIFVFTSWPAYAYSFDNGLPPIDVEIKEDPHKKHDQDKEDEKVSIIVEVKGDPKKHKEYLEIHHPFVEVVATYDKLFHGLALKAKPERLEKMKSLEFIKAIHPVRTYEAVAQSPVKKDKNPNAVIPSQINTTNYTGKGVKVGVVDTGIDYEHPDLKSNYSGGYDLVDLDKDPMETEEDEGMPTLHGTHVAGIIAADGDLQGVAPDAEIYAYRALGPGGRGTSVQVIAALEQAVEDGMDVVNLSLGNSVNGPDYPTSIAVNRAVEHGTSVVTANGNDGPKKWTVGSPATATKALAVGASTRPQRIPFLYEPKEEKAIPLVTMMGAKDWTFEKSLPIVDAEDPKANVAGKIAIIERGKIPFQELAIEMQEQGAEALLIVNNEKGMFQGVIENKEDIEIPVASISKEDGNWLRKQMNGKSLHIDTAYQETKTDIALFSSRGPVTINWDIKPDIVAPGANILSTVPDGYQELQGTSMAAPHVAGALALMKEARPNWSHAQIVGALKTTAVPIQNEKKHNYDPIVQGTGDIQVERAIATKTIIHDPLISFGKIKPYKETNSMKLTIENTTNKKQTYTFDIPKKQKGLTWNLPQTFTLDKKEKKEIPIELSVTSPELKKGVHQGWITLHQKDETFQLPYLFVNETADYPKAMGFELSLKTFSDDTYIYRLYLTEDAKNIEVNLYNPDTLMHERTLLEEEDLSKGMNEGKLKKTKASKPGRYLALITVQLEDGTYESQAVELFIE
ncbi:MAG TPA: S8 family serine peptidase [Virgibacillus sp.]|nr:S8 family serine peptidase [Virgibacillus sp.]HLR67719.1 S8 family serine peptidase [Virgibacillus sp.]